MSILVKTKGLDAAKIDLLNWFLLAQESHCRYRKSNVDFEAVMSQSGNPLNAQPG